MTKLYFAYIRVSTVKQTEGASLTAQRDAITRFAGQNGHEIIQWFEEKETAAKQGRPLFTQMVKSLKRGKAQGVIMHKIDRSARNFRDWATIGELHDDGVEVHFANENVDFTSRGGRLSADIQAVFAADYIRNLKEEIAKGQKSRLEQGLYPFTAPMGYLDMGKGKPKTIDPVTGPTVRLMFELYATGQFSIVSLQDELWRRGARTKNGKKIYHSKIEVILADPFYMGLIKIKKTGATYPGIHKPLITAELFRKVQEVKEGRSRRKRTKHNHLFRGLFTCATCGNSMIPERQRSHVYYRCHTKTCPPNCIRETTLTTAIKQKLTICQIDPKQLGEFQTALTEWLLEIPKPANADTIQAELAKIEGAKDRLTNALMNGTIDEDTYREKCSQLQFRKVEISRTRENHRSREDQADLVRRFLEHSKSLAETYVSATDAEKRQLIALCFSNMSVADKTPQLSTRNWIVEALDWPVALSCAAHRGENRRMLELRSQNIQRTIDALGCPEARAFVGLCEGVSYRAKTNDLPENATEDAYSKAA